MVLLTHHTQSSFSAIPLRTSSWSNGITLRPNVVRFQMNLRTNRHISLKHAFPLRPTSRYVRGVRGKSLHISSFKGNVHDDKTGDPASKPVSPKSSVQISFFPHDREETESPSTQDAPCASNLDKTISHCQSINGLFSRWLSHLRTGASAEAGADILERPSGMHHLSVQNADNSKERGEILKVVMCYFLGLDATITVPLIIFIPLYLAVYLKNGSQVARELTPLWIIGPLIIALYVKLLRGIFALYVFTFKQTVKVVQNFPTYYSVASNYISEGKFKDVQARFWQPITDLKNLDYKELSMRKLKVLQEWVVERYLDFIESLWPHYCRTIRFLKRANLI